MDDDSLTPAWEALLASLPPARRADLAARPPSHPKAVEAAELALCGGEGEGVGGSSSLSPSFPQDLVCLLRIINGQSDDGEGGGAGAGSSSSSSRRAPGAADVEDDEGDDPDPIFEHSYALLSVHGLVRAHRRLKERWGIRKGETSATIRGPSGGILGLGGAMSAAAAAGASSASSPPQPIRIGSANREDDRLGWNPAWVPFASSSTGDYLFVDRDPGPGGKVGQVLEWLCDGGTVWRAPDLGTFLLQMAQQGGRLVGSGAGAAMAVGDEDGETAATRGGGGDGEEDEEDDDGGLEAASAALRRAAQQQREGRGSGGGMVDEGEGEEDDDDL
jgi:cell wall assembly regulator SMI1